MSSPVIRPLIRKITTFFSVRSRSIRQAITTFPSPVCLTARGSGEVSRPLSTAGQQTERHSQSIENRPQAAPAPAAMFGKYGECGESGGFGEAPLAVLELALADV
jgi:hypothetical protein